MCPLALKEQHPFPMLFHMISLAHRRRVEEGAKPSVRYTLMGTLILMTQQTRGILTGGGFEHSSRQTSHLSDLLPRLFTVSACFRHVYSQIQ